MKIIINALFLITLNFTLLSGQSNWYVNQQEGSDQFDGRTPNTAFKTIEHSFDSAVKPGDTLFVMGEYINQTYNPDYTYSGDINDSQIWKKENTIDIRNIDGKPGKFITIKAFDDNTIIKGDGNNIFRIINCSYLRIEGLELMGEVNKIPLSTAKALQFLYKDKNNKVHYRVPPGTSDNEIAQMTFQKLKNIRRPTYTDTRGIYFSSVHHIDIINNHVHHTPGNGFRVADCEYVNIVGNEVDNCSRKSFSGTHGLVVTKATSTDNFSGYKIKIIGNSVHHNYNEIYSWAPSKTIIKPIIDEGKGISLQRNDDNSNWSHGRFLVANNICYWNGYSGIHSNSGKRIDFINNTCYMNSYTKSIYEAGQHTTGGNIGISTQNGDDIRIINNIAYIDGKLKRSAIAASNTINLVVKNNIIYSTTGILQEDEDVVDVQVNTKIIDPKFQDTDSFDFSLQHNSPAIDMADTLYAPKQDFYRKTRDSKPDIGAIEYIKLTDNDNDGYTSDIDCDDNNADVNPGATEIPYNGLDDDCDSETLDDDLDQDGYDHTTDCDDNNADVNPGATEIPYNGLDDDCNSETLDDDLDQDGYDHTTDCDDNNADVNPGAIEIPYNGLDDDCNSETLDDDLDQDGYVIADDCDDTNPNIYPGATEIPNNGIDEDCDGEDLVTSVNTPEGFSFSLSPNPTNDYLYLNGDLEFNFKICIYDIYGDRQLSLKNSKEIYLGNLLPGMYFIKVLNTANNYSIVKKIIVKW